MCLVYEAEHILLKQAVALKLLKPDLARDPNAVARFAQEAQASAQLRSPNVARVYDVDKLPNGQPYITMELLVGHDLGTELQRRYSLPLELAVDYVRQAAMGISEAHALGIVHRDLKPENLFLTELGRLTDRRLVKILDFGIAKNVHQGARKLTAPDAVFGTVDYMSPEQIRSSATVDHRTDIWSLGVILFELLTGQTPYSGDARAVIAQIIGDPVLPPTRFVPSLPPGLVAVVMKALSKDPSLRFASAEQLRLALEPFCTRVEPITDVLARIPVASLPRRNLDVGRPPSDAREVRTNLSFETSSPKGAWSHRGALVPLCGAAAITFVGVAMWKTNLLGARHREVPSAVTAAPSAAETTAPGVAETAVPSLPTVSAEGTGTGVPTSPLPSATPAELPAQASNTAKAGPKPRAIPRPSGPSARPSATVTQAPPPPAPTPAPAALPKHI